MFEQISSVAIEKGIGFTAVIVIIVMFVFFVRQQSKLIDKNNKEQIAAQNRMAEATNNVADALSIIKETFVDRMYCLEMKSDKVIDMFDNHGIDNRRLEGRCDKIFELVSKIEERTKHTSSDSSHK